MQLEGESATEALGAKVARYSSAPLVVYLNGDLGSGKTTFVRGFIHSYGHKGTVKSPTFTLIETYKLEQATLYHVDLYRLQDPQELEYLGIRELSSESDAICLIEWPQQGGENLPPADLELFLEHNGDYRKVRSVGLSPKGQSIIGKI